MNQFPLKLTNDTITYMEVSVRCIFKHLFKHNLKVVLEETKQDLRRWPVLPVSLAGRTNNILPRFFFSPQTLFVLIPKSFFKKKKKEEEELGL